MLPANCPVPKKSFFVTPLSIFSLLLCLTCGCITKKSMSAPPANSKHYSIARAPNRSSSNTAAEDDSVPPPGGFSWHDLALRASRRSETAQLTALKIECSDLENLTERSWRDPQLRLNSDMVSSKEYDRGGANSHDDSHEHGASIRFYISNPFVNRWIKSLKQPNARLIQAKTHELAYAVYCETKTKCMEATVIKDEIDKLRKISDHRKKMRDRYTELRRDGYAAPVKMLRNAIRLAKTSIKLECKQREYRDTLQMIALLSGVAVDKIKLLDINRQQLPDPQSFQLAMLVSRAVNQRADIELARASSAVAENELKAARAAQIPWFEFAEAGYSRSTSDTSEYTSPRTTRSDENSDEWMIRTAVTLPLFSWLGNDETQLRRVALRAARAHEAVIVASLYNEINSALQNYTDAYHTHMNAQQNVSKQIDKLNQSIREVGSSKTVVDTEIMELQEELYDLKSELHTLLYDCLESLINLESITGGTYSHKFTESE